MALHPYRFIYVMANTPNSNSELLNGQAMMSARSRSCSTPSITTTPSSLRPFTIKMLLDALFEHTEQYPLVIDGMPVSSVDLLGMVTNKSLSMDHFTFDLYDGTGSVNVLYCNGMYVCVVGRTTGMEQFFQIKAYIVWNVVIEQTRIGEIYTTIDDRHFKSSRI